jgi:DNA-directed RNA polymerase I, II, and III subunit RPABC2
MDQLRFDSRLLHAEVQPISRETIETNNRTTLPYYSKYEFTTLMGMRAQQLSDGAKPMVSLSGLQPSHPQFVWKLAHKEIEERVLPFIVHRRLPNGISEYWSATELSIVW